MVRRTALVIVLIVLTAVVATSAASAAELSLNAVTFPEGKSVDLELTPTDRAPRADVEAEVRYRDGQAQVEVEFDDLKPAVLFGGDITCYVVWAVKPDSTFENLGELFMDYRDGKVKMSTGLKRFALMITAEAYSLVDAPSELVVFTNQPAEAKRADTSSFTFRGLRPAAPHEQENIVTVRWDSDTPLDLVQAEKAFELAERTDASSYAPGIMSDAQIKLSQARNLAESSKDKTRRDYSRRAIALASEAIQIAVRRQEAERLARQIAERRAEMEALEARAQEAEQQAEKAETAMERSRAQLEAAREEIGEANRRKAKALEAQREAEAAVREAEAEHRRLAAEKLTLLEEQAELRRSLDDMEATMAELREEKEQLSSRLEGALSKVASTKSSARGFIVNLPDILFDTNESTLKPDAKIVIAKLAGILLIMQDLNLRIEGHTDSKGSEAYNQKLSERRADSVRTFLHNSGINVNRMIAVGYGENRPVANNDTAEGRQQNRRVEIVIAEGEVKEGEAPE
jgi:outer membrane protein OmpA-like peptidoglycan-associated protein